MASVQRFIARSKYVYMGQCSVLSGPPPNGMVPEWCQKSFAAAAARALHGWEPFRQQWHRMASREPSHDQAMVGERFPEVARRLVVKPRHAAPSHRWGAGALHSRKHYENQKNCMVSGEAFARSTDDRRAFSRSLVERKHATRTRSRRATIPQGGAITSSTKTVVYVAPSGRAWLP